MRKTLILHSESDGRPGREPVNLSSRAYLPNVFLNNNCSVCLFWLITTSISTEQWILGNASKREKLSELNSPLGNFFLASFTSGSLLFIFLGPITHGIFSLALPSAPSHDWSDKPSSFPCLCCWCEFLGLCSWCRACAAVDCQLSLLLRCVLALERHFEVPEAFCGRKLIGFDKPQQSLGCLGVQHLLKPGRKSKRSGVHSPPVQLY